MEEPVTFALWVAVAPEKKVEAERLLQRAQPELARFLLLQRVARGLHERAPVLLVDDVGWSEVQRWKSEAEHLGPPTVYQARFGPAEAHRLRRCVPHDLRYAGILGCPLCIDYYRR
jgi:hypothetical protein